MVFPVVLMISMLPSAAVEQVDFDTQIVPVLTKAGCNVGSCHGAAAGRGGFKLSLYGSDAAFDHQSIALELEGRRVNIAAPDQSLLLRKATCEIDHGGGYRLDADESGAKLLQRWIAGGATRPQECQLVDFQVTPTISVVDTVGGHVTLKATARFDDDSVRDVTSWTVFTPEDLSSIEIDERSAVATVLRRGRHVVTARYLSQVVAIELIVPLNDALVDLSGEPKANFVDRWIDQRLETLRLPLSPQADDATFLRRLRLDLTGQLPTPDEVEQFLSQTDADKRTRWIERFLHSDEFVDYWTHRFADLLRIRSPGGNGPAAAVYHHWLRKQIADDTPYDRIAATLVTAEGDTHAVGPANFYRTVGGAREQAEFFSELFLGVRLRCANCHNHPLDHWTQDDYHGLAAMFAGLRTGQVISYSPGGEVSHPRTGQAAVPRIPGERFLPGDTDRRPELADWLIDRANPYFARAAVNRLWKALFGRGLVDPTDDLRATNPPTHPRLLTELADDLVENDYDLRHTIRLISNSRAYGRSTRTLEGNQADDRYYSHALVRPLSAEVLADALSDAMGVAEQYGDMQIGTRAIQLTDAGIAAESLDALGRCSREASCESNGGSAGGGLPLKLHLINGQLINRRIGAPTGRLQRLLDAGRSSKEIVEHFYLRCLSRHPSEDEVQYWNEQLRASPEDTEYVAMVEDFVWALLTCREFTTNH